MSLVTQVIMIHAPVGTVYQYISNHENYTAWFPGALSVKSTDTLPHGTVGKVYAEEVRMPSGRYDTMAIRVAKTEKNHLFQTESKLGPFLTQMTIALEVADPHTTKLTWTFSSRNGFLLRGIFTLLTRRDLTRRTEEGLQTLKHTLEKK